MQEINLEGKTIQAHHIKTEKGNLLMLQANNGFVGCGYFDIATADRLGEHVAIVTGVKTYEDVLNAQIIKVSKAAQEKGITEGMSGKEALIKLSS